MENSKKRKVTWKILIISKFNKKRQKERFSVNEGLKKDWDGTVNIGTLSIQKSTDTNGYGYHAVLIHLGVQFHT